MPISVMPSARTVTVLLRILSTSISLAFTLRIITLASPLSLSPLLLTIIRPSTFTFSSLMPPRPTPPEIYKSPLMVVLRRVTSGAVIVTLPKTPPSS